MSEIPYKSATMFAFVHEGTTEGWAQYLFATETSARAFGGDWKGRVVRVAISAVEVGPVIGKISPIPF